MLLVATGWTLFQFAGSAQAGADAAGAWAPAGMAVGMSGTRAAGCKVRHACLPYFEYLDRYDPGLKPAGLGWVISGLKAAANPKRQKQR